MESVLSTKSLYRLLENGSSYKDGSSKKTLPFNNHILTGSIEYLLLEPGLYMLTLDLSLKRNCFIIDKDYERLERKYFLFTYLLSPHFDYISGKKEDDKSITDPCLLTSFSNCKLELLMKKNSLIQATIFIFSEEWMEEQLVSNRGEMESNLFDLFICSRITTLTNAEILLLKSGNQSKNLLKTRMYAFNLILNSLENRNFQKKKISVIKPINTDTLKEVEKKIQDHLYSSMPSIDEMAKEFFMSVSTLKRQFKRAYGSNVYEYYLSRKMQLAKNLLETENIKVSEVAAQLHYENVSHFIKIFKKIHGFPPGKISRTKETGFIPFFNEY